MSWNIDPPIFEDLCPSDRDLLSGDPSNRNVWRKGSSRFCVIGLIFCRIKRRGETLSPSLFVSSQLRLLSLKEKKGAKCKRPSRHDDDVVVDPCLLLMSLFILYPSSSSFSTLCHLSWQSAKERIWCPWIPTACRILTSKLDSSPTRTTSRKRPRPSKRRSTRSGTKRSHCKCVLHLRVLHYLKKTFVFF